MTTAACLNCFAPFPAADPDEVMFCAECAPHTALSEEICHFPDMEAESAQFFCGRPWAADLPQSRLNSNITCAGCRAKMRALGAAYRQAREEVLGRKDYPR